jgi:hypothetical protein
MRRRQVYAAARAAEEQSKAALLIPAPEVVDPKVPAKRGRPVGSKNKTGK